MPEFLFFVLEIVVLIVSMLIASFMLVTVVTANFLSRGVHFGPPLVSLLLGVQVHMADIARGFAVEPFHFAASLVSLVGLYLILCAAFLHLYVGVLMVGTIAIWFWLFTISDGRLRFVNRDGTLRNT